MDTKTFRKKDLIEIVNRLAGALDTRGVMTFDELRGYIGKKISFPNLPEDFIEISDRRGVHETYGIRISYTRADLGIPIETVSDLDLGVTQVIVKLRGAVKNYQPFSIDALGNIIQSRVFHSSQLSDVKKELTRLQDSKSYFRLR